MKHLSTVVCRLMILSLAGLLCVADVHAGAYQPAMEEALDCLEKATDATDPVPMLQQARGALQKAKRNKGGRRMDAIETIDKAIAIAQSGGDPKDKITHAIAMVRSGMTRGNN